jgi:hypothetical protein
MTMCSVTPDDMLEDRLDGKYINGVYVRKGSVAAFFANIDIIQNPFVTVQQSAEAIDQMKGLAPGLVAIGLGEHCILKNTIAHEILIETAENDL